MPRSLKEIVIKPQGGLANRMRAIDSAILIAEGQGRRVKVLWEKSFELNCSFKRLFNLPDIIELHEYYRNGIYKRFIDFSVRNLRKAGLHLPPGFDVYLYDSDTEAFLEKNLDFMDIVNPCVSVYINTVNQFYSNEDSFKKFVPIPALQQSVKSYTDSFKSNTVGIHIRRKDNFQSIKFSPIEEFIELMKMEISKNPDTNFFLATDSPEVEKQLEELFSSRIITHKKSLSRNSEEGIQDALIDMFCLSGTTKILGSYYSSFSEVAAQIGRIHLLQVYKAQD